MHSTGVKPDSAQAFGVTTIVLWLRSRVDLAAEVQVQYGDISLHRRWNLQERLRRRRFQLRLQQPKLRRAQRPLSEPQNLRKTGGRRRFRLL